MRCALHPLQTDAYPCRGCAWWQVPMMREAILREGGNWRQLADKQRTGVFGKGETARPPAALRLSPALHACAAAAKRLQPRPPACCVSPLPPPPHTHTPRNRTPAAAAAKKLAKERMASMLAAFEYLAQMEPEAPEAPAGAGGAQPSTSAADLLGQPVKVSCFRKVGGWLRACRCCSSCPAATADQGSDTDGIA